MKLERGIGQFNFLMPNFVASCSKLRPNLVTKTAIDSGYVFEGSLFLNQFLKHTLKHSRKSQCSLKHLCSFIHKLMLPYNRIFQCLLKYGDILKVTSPHKNIHHAEILEVHVINSTLVYLHQT